MLRGWRPFLLILPLAACDPAQVADKVGRRAAESVVRPVVDDGLTGVQADTATRCIVANARAEEVRALARDVGTYAGTSTEARVRAIAARPEVVTCLAAAGLPPLAG